MTRDEAIKAAAEAITPSKSVYGPTQDAVNFVNMAEALGLLTLHAPSLDLTERRAADVAESFLSAECSHYGYGKPLIAKLKAAGLRIVEK